MREVLTLNRALHISTRIFPGSKLSLGEFFSLMEDHVKMEFFNEITSRIKCGKQYLFSIKVLDADTDEWTGIITEMFEFTMFELEDNDIVVDKNEYELRRFIRW